MKQYAWLITFYLVTFIPGLLSAQGENNVWTFGSQNGLRFNTNPPTFFQTNSWFGENSASISDAAGNLLFYSNGQIVWDANGNVMPNSIGLLGNGPSAPGLPGGTAGSSAQGVTIVKSPANAQQYYLFTLDAGEDWTPIYTGYLRYSIIDMTLNGGSGDIMPGQKNIVLGDYMNEAMAVIKGAGCFYWIVVHKYNQNTFQAYKLDATGIHPPISSAGSALSAEMYQIVGSFAGDRLMSLSHYNLELATFNNATGTVSNFIDVPIDQPFPINSACFSPDDNKIYVTGWGLLQYDITTYPNAPTIAATRVLVSNQMTYYQLRNGPDGKIYIANDINPFIATINNPNNAGLTCNLNPNALPQPAWSSLAFPNGSPYYGRSMGHNMVVGDMAELETNITDTLICQTDTFRINAPVGYQDFIWSNGSNERFLDITTGGKYWVVSNNDCKTRIDSFQVELVTFGKNLGRDTFLCPGGEITLNMTTDDASYLWQDGSNQSSFHVSEAGKYYVTVQKENCIRRDTITITAPEPSPEIIADSMLCIGSEMDVLAKTIIPGTYLWNTGSKDNRIHIKAGGQYSVTVKNTCGTFEESVTIAEGICDCTPFIPTAFSPNGDGINDIFLPRMACDLQSYTLSIYNRYGNPIFSATLPDSGWDGRYKGKQADIGVYFYTLQFTTPSGELSEKRGEVTLVR